MTIYTREELMKTFKMCGDLARYHMEAAKVAFVCNRADVEYHMGMTDHYIKVREDLLHLIIEGS